MNRFENIMIVSDMDGTFLGEKGTLVPRNLEAISYFCAHGGKFTFASGRSHDYIMLSVPHPEEIINLPSVAVNGVGLYDFEQNRYVETYPIDASVSELLVERVFTVYPHVGIRLITGDRVLIGNLHNPYMKEEWERVASLDRRIITSVEDVRGISPFKIVLRADSEVLAVVWRELEQELGDRLVFTKSGETLVETMTVGHNKGTMVKHLQRTYAPETTLLCAVGDFLNDLEMLEVADLPVCPANACEEVKARCKLCLCDHKEGVIADLIEYLDKQM